MPVSEGYSNILADDYAGPSACADCHPDKHAKWSRSLHRAMNRIAAADTVRGEFSGTEIEYPGGTARFDGSGGNYSMALFRDRVLVRRFRITRTIGSASLQEYVGVQIEGPEPAGDPVYSTEIRLPFGYWIDLGGWFHQQYFDSWFGAEYTSDGEPAIDPSSPDITPWDARCPWCHNTYAFATRVARAHGDAPRGFGPEKYVALTAPQRDQAWRNRVVGDNRLPIDELVSVGISCESCHFGGRRHAEGQGPMVFWPTSPALTEVAGFAGPRGGKDSGPVINTLCAQCHSAPSPLFPDGSAVRNSREALDLIAGGCASAIGCTDCHDPHVSGSGRAEPDRVCVQCHDDLAPPAIATQHSRHDASVGCADCHMPRIVQGITKVVRSHRISSPGGPNMVGPAAPNACNLCHLDRTFGWTAAQLAQGWGIEVTPDRGDHPAGRDWLASDSRDTALVAVDGYARSQDKPAALSALLPLLDHPVAYDRMRIGLAVESILGRRLTHDEYDPTAPPIERSRQARSLATRLDAR